MKRMLKDLAYAELFELGGVVYAKGAPQNGGTLCLWVRRDSAAFRPGIQALLSDATLVDPAPKNITKQEQDHVEKHLIRDGK